ncbi:glycosyltransferase family 4 protein [Bacillus sp. REN16]|uniref:glycosyltransferase family 4 protein n=1 Tax=Bacillus sp. REN16 TaxID=2887296 RepID=UPI001E53E3CE|nr:glycosyltransferase family 4 protein [Bacillus sp. REN16]MCC3356089.1 glycosyltransferase family 4 protein [Bacillus sp. REN16]
MKILNINSYYLSSSLYQPMEENLKRTGLNLTTYVPIHSTYKARKEISFPLPEHVYVSKCYKKYERIFFHLKHTKIIRDFFIKFKLENYDILHAHSLFSNGYIAYLSYKKYKKPYIVTVRSTDINVFFKRMLNLRRLGLNILLNANQVIFLSESHKNECFEKYIPSKYKSQILKKTLIIPNGIDNFWFENKPVEPMGNIKTEKAKLIFVGDDSKRKNLKTLVSACDFLVGKKYQIELYVAGNINEKTKMNLVEKKYINFLGHVKKEELLLLYRQSDIFVLPSITETFGLVYAEAMSQGLPVLYTKEQGFDNQFDDGVVGYPVNCMDPIDIADKIIKVLDKYNDFYKRNIQLVNKFKWENIVKMYEQIYKNSNYNNL